MTLAAFTSAPSVREVAELMAKSPKPMLEKHLQETCTQFLELDGWRALRMETVRDRSRGKGFGEPGMPDHLYIRYGLHPTTVGHPGWDCHITQAEVWWIEYKRAKGGSGKKALFQKAEKAKIHQLAWHAAERARGALVWLCGVDFEPTPEGFAKAYAASGLQRKDISMGGMKRG